MLILLTFTFRQKVVADSLIPFSFQDARQLSLEDAHSA